MKATWTKRAQLELAEIFDYIALDNEDAAIAWVERLIDRADSVAGMKYSGRAVAEVDTQDVREVVFASYRIVYRVLASGIRVLTVFEGHRQFPDDLDLDDDREAG